MFKTKFETKKKKMTKLHEREGMIMRNLEASQWQQVREIKAAPPH